jgi:hypothetical protein
VISGGVNHKSPTAVALGRQGPFFLWGFSAGPKDMTESGRRVFLNSLVYTAKFDRAPLLVRVTRDSRDRVPWMIGFIAAAKENHAEYLEAARKHNQEQKAAREKAKTAPEKLTDNEKFLLRVSEWPLETLARFSRYFYTSFPPDVVKRCGDDATKYQAWYIENRPYVYGPRPNYAEVDEDAKALGIANDDPKLLDACVTALEQGKDVHRATRLLRRYTGESFAKPAEWRAWLTASRADLFFSDMGGYRFFAKSGPDAGHRRALRALSLDEPTATSPVALTAVVRPASATMGETVTVAVLDRTGQPIGKADPMIAAIALQHSLELVTGNTAHSGFNNSACRFGNGNAGTRERIGEVPLVGLERTPDFPKENASPEKSGAESGAVSVNSDQLPDLETIAAALRKLSAEDRARVVALLGRPHCGG